MAEVEQKNSASKRNEQNARKLKKTKMDRIVPESHDQGHECEAGAVGALNVNILLESTDDITVDDQNVDDFVYHNVTDILHVVLPNLQSSGKVKFGDTLFLKIG